MMYAEILNKIRAKSEGSDLLLKDHILQSLERAKQLRDFVEINDLVLPFEDKEKMFESLAIALFIHDLGKISYEFQKEVYKKEWNQQKDLKNFLKGTGKIKDHEILSAVWSSILLHDNSEWTRILRSAILLHHYNDFYIGEKDLAEIVQNYEDEVVDYLNFLNENWNILFEILEKLRDYVTEKLGDESIKNSLEKINLKETKQRIEKLLELIREKGDLLSFAEFYNPTVLDSTYYRFIVFMGSLRRCDYSASGGVEIEFTNKTLEEIYSKVEEEIKKQLKESLWQDEELKKCDGNSAVLVAPTGSGKTEFSLLWAKNTGKKLVYTLPLRVALNDLYRRFLNYAESEKATESEIVGLLHSTAFTEKLDEEEKASETSINKKFEASKLLSYPLTLSTPDQIFLASLNFYGSDKIISIFPFSALVLDEIQSYNPEMAAIIIKTLKIAEILGSKILVMTATFTPYFKPFFGIEENNLLLTEKDNKILNNYKINTIFIDTEKNKTKIKNYCNTRHRVELIKDTLIQAKQEDRKTSYKINQEKLKELIQKIWNSGKNNVIFVLNNVSKAIELYKILNKIKKDLKIKNDSVFLLHSRMLEIKKSEVIEKIRKKLSDREKFILVATQVIEASVNLDFDVMITEISPIDSQIQRWGRVWRNRDQEYSANEPNIYVFCTKGENEEFDKGTRYVYSGEINKQLLNKTLEKIKEIEGNPLNYEEERKLIEEVFKETWNGKTLAKHYFEEILRNLEFLNYVNVEKKSQAQKIFRKIGGLQVVIPQAMLIHPSPMKDINHKLANLIIEKIEKNETELNWDRIEEIVGIKKEAGGKWILRKIIIDFSVNVPIFCFEKIWNKIREFKGFYVLKVDENDAQKILEYGIDEFLNEKTGTLNEEDEFEESRYL